jgi:hypothetical protein
MPDSDEAPVTSAGQRHLEYSHPTPARSIIAAFMAALPMAFVLPAGAAFPDVTATAAYTPGIDRATLSAVARTATKGYANPDVAVVSKVRRSRATSGTGYCGEVTIEGGTATTLFHVILRTPRGPSVVRLSDYSREGDPLTATANVMMHDFGCTP